MSARPATAPRRRWPRRLGWTALALAAGLAAVLAWLLASGGGRDTALGWVQGQLDEGALDWARAEGSLGGTLVLHDLRWRGDGVEVRVRRLALSLQPSGLLGGALRLDQVEAEAVQVRLDEAAEPPPEPWPAWPALLPRLDLPLPVSVRALRVDGLVVSRGDATLFALDEATARDLALEDGGGALGHGEARGGWGTVSAEGHYRPARDYASDLRLRAARRDPEAPGTTAARTDLHLHGDLGTLALDGNLEAGGKLTLALQVSDGRATPRWRLRADGDGLEPGRLGLGEGAPLGLALSLDGIGPRAEGALRLDEGGRAWPLQDLALRFAGAGVVLEAATLALPAGEVALSGRWDPLDAEPLALDARSDALAWAPAGGGDPVTASGQLAVQGLPSAWTARLEARLQRAGEEATLAARGQGDTGHAELESLSLRTPGGTLQGEGRVAWTPALALRLDATLDQLDPGYLLPDYPGALSGRLQADLVQRAGGWQGDARLDDLRGRLRGRPLQANARLAWRGEGGRIEAEARLGDSRLRAIGDIGARLDLRLSATPLQLADLRAGAGGEVRGELQLQGPRAAPGLRADLQASGLAWPGLQADSARLRGDLPARGDGGTLVLEADGLRLGGVGVDTLQVRATGSQDALRVEASARSDEVALRLAGTALREAGARRGRIEALSLRAPRAPDLALQAPADWRWRGERFELEPACLAGEGEGRLCLQGDGRTWRADGERIPLALAQPWLPDSGLPLRLDGVLALRAEASAAAGGWRGQARIESREGALSVPAGDGPRRVLAYRDLRLDARVDGDALEAEASAGLNDEGELKARLAAAPGADGALAGEASLRMRDLTWLELFSPDIVRPRGRLDGSLRVSGTRAAPVFDGGLALRELATELPALGLSVRGGQLDLQARPDGSALLSGQVRSGEGVLRVDGSFEPGRPQPVQAALTGRAVTVSDTPDLRLVVDPALVLDLGGGRLRIGGRVDVPSARVNLEALDGPVKPSPDVVLVDAESPRDDGPVLDLALHIALGEDVRLQGFGLDGRLGGALDIRQAPGRAAIATGTLAASGRYRAYGQDLSITRARLGYTGSPIDDPSLDILAERQRGDVTIGVEVRGRASRPVTRITSSPAMDTSEALSWLVFGRPLQSTSRAESGQLESAALALGVGGNLLAQQLGEGLGLDSAGVEESRALGGATFSVGKYLSPRLFLGYGISLVGRGQVVTLKYLLGKGFDVAIESGTESAASLNWRTER